MTVPWYLSKPPYAVQTAALEAANGQRGYGFFMEMGLGKTATTLAEFVSLLMKDEVDCAVVIMPNSLKQNWADEALENGLDSVPVVLWPDKPKASGNFILCVNYEAMIGRGGEYVEDVLKKRKAYLALDESVHVKNPQAKRTKKIIALAKHATYVRILSGAPIVQSPLDVWGQLRTCGHLSGWNSFAFRNRFCQMGGYLGKQIVGARNEVELAQILDAHSFRATKAEWTDLPGQLYTYRHYEMKGEQKAAYDEMLKEFVTQWQDESIAAPMVITQSMKLQQISSGFIIDEEGETHELVKPKDNPKLRLLKEVVEEQSGKVLVFCFYRHTVHTLRDAFDKCAYMFGGVASDEITEQKKLFNEGDAKIFVIQLSTGKYGHTLLGNEEWPCHTAVFYENNYDLDARIQAEARNHRHGQKYPVTYIDFVGTSLDKKIIDALHKKQKLASTIVDFAKGERK